MVACALLPYFGGKSCRQLAFSAGAVGNGALKIAENKKSKSAVKRKFSYKALRNFNPGTILISGKLSVLLERFIVAFMANGKREFVPREEVFRSLIVYC